MFQSYRRKIDTGHGSTFRMKAHCIESGAAAQVAQFLAFKNKMTINPRDCGIYDICPTGCSIGFWIEMRPQHLFRDMGGSPQLFRRVNGVWLRPTHEIIE